ncbi:hypothetical protein NMS06_003544 [Vibrio cholerae]|nr:hypothetical protein [Vibrio cholerae]EJL6442171.1 hypothetical protein [Vibrio cholerae]
MAFDVCLFDVCA